MMHSQSKRQQPLFHLEEDFDNPRRSSVGKKPPSIITSSSKLNPSLSRTASNQTDFTNINSVLQFPIENSHSYSYAHLSPNSLALRLNVLKRSLEILKERPKWFRAMNHEAPNNSDEEDGASELTVPDDRKGENGFRSSSAVRFTMTLLERKR
ncbi:hypothetical protein CJI97_002966 [Candidozyma auris]|nr:hypothetical protein CJI97_002966 [[Candida] auris]